MKQTDITSFAFTSAMIGIAATTIGHYAEVWGIGYAVSIFTPTLYALMFSASKEQP